jgi:excisionase family DNA binding protein
VTITRFTPLASCPEMLRVEECAAVLDVSKGVVYAMCKAGTLGSCRIGRLCRVPRAALQQFIDAAHKDQGVTT